MKNKLDSVHLTGTNTRKMLSSALMAVICVLAFIAPMFVSKYVLRILIMLCVYAILSVSLNMVSGYLGEISLGHSIFLAIGAYASSILVTKLTMNYWVSVLVAASIAGLFGALLGLQTLKVSGAYLAIVSLGYYYVVRTIIIIWEPVTNGAIGIFNIPAATFFGEKLAIKNNGAYYHILVFLLLTLLVDHLVIHSKVGRAIQAIREDRLAADMVGIYTDRYRIVAFAMSGFFAGLAGAFYGQFITYINPSNFTYDMSIMVLAMVLTVVLLCLNLMSARWSEAVGVALNAALTVVSAPMVCSNFYVLPLFLWGTLLMGTFGKK